MNWYKMAQLPFQSTGTLRYHGTPEDGWVTLEVDDPGRDLARYYRSLIPKYKHPRVNPQKYPTHITVVRKGKEQVQDPEAWGKHEGEIVSFSYGNTIGQSKTGAYFTIPVQSPRLEEIREELGLPSHREGYDDFHITIGNKKELH